MNHEIADAATATSVQDHSEHKPSDAPPVAHEGHEPSGHALGLAISLTTSLSSAMAARNGILVKDRLALEESRTVDAFLFNKTGTLTKGEHTVMGVTGAGITKEDVLRLAGGVESDSEHPEWRRATLVSRLGDTAHSARAVPGRLIEVTKGVGWRRQGARAQCWELRDSRLGRARGTGAPLLRPAAAPGLTPCCERAEPSALATGRCGPRVRSG